MITPANIHSLVATLRRTSVFITTILEQMHIIKYVIIWTLTNVIVLFHIFQIIKIRQIHLLVSLHYICQYHGTLWWSAENKLEIFLRKPSSPVHRDQLRFEEKNGHEMFILVNLNCILDILSNLRWIVECISQFFLLYQYSHKSKAVSQRDVLNFGSHKSSLVDVENQRSEQDNALVHNVTNISNKLSNYCKRKYRSSFSSS